MSFFEILSTVFIGPLKLVFELVFAFANKVINNPGLSIIALSMIMNILLLPLYRRADAVQEASRDVEAKLQKGVAHIKKCFSGDEQMMILQTYYRQNNYKPTDALNGSVSLLLEVPFFMAAYQFLSTLPILQGTSLGPITDLGAPDALIVIGGLTINALPIIMTLVNIISSAIYLKGFPLKTKIQLYAMALFFLVFLYTSPSGLVFYWTLNNLFSLGKNLFCKLRNPKKVATIGVSIIGLVVVGFAFFGYTGTSVKAKVVLVGLGVAAQMPLLITAFKDKLQFLGKGKSLKPNKKVFVLGALLLTVLTGLLIPSAVIASSPQEFVDLNYLRNPLWYCVSTVSISAGTFLVWLGVFYWLANDKGKAIFDRIVWILCGVMIVNYMFFEADAGMLSATLQYELRMEFPARVHMINLAVMAVVVAACCLTMKKWKSAVATVILVALVALGGMATLNMVTIQRSVSDVSHTQEDTFPHFQMSKNGKNVVVLMLDRAMNGYLPYFFNEKPELKEQFEGFTHYPNTVSFGLLTNIATPALFGGYEYTPVEINKRASESLESKHNEALKVMPVLFAESGFDVTVVDPPYAGYQWIPDLSIYDAHPEIHGYLTNGKFSDPEHDLDVIKNNHRNFFCFSIMKTMPTCVQSMIYNWGVYNQVASTSYSNQMQHSMSIAEGQDVEFMESYDVIRKLSQMTNIVEDDTDTFLLMSSQITHAPMILQEPEYIPAGYVNNESYDAAHQDRFIVDGKQLRIDNKLQMMHYHVNMAAMVQLGNWFDYLRENGIYDNTRIILVADHGFATFHFDEMIMNGFTAENSNPLLMVKDFNSDTFAVSDEFMTNADVPMLAMDAVIENPKNPFTEKPINDDEKFAHDQFVSLSLEADVDINNGNTFLPGKWASVKTDMRDRSNWSFCDQEVVLTEHALP